jgi:hypothetical protein
MLEEDRGPICTFAPARTLTALPRLAWRERERADSPVAGREGLGDD